MKILCRYLSPQKGDVLIDRVSVKRMNRVDIAQKIGMVAQETHFLFPFTGQEVVLMGRTPYLGHRLFESEKDLEIARRRCSGRKPSLCGEAH